MMGYYNNNKATDEVIKEYDGKKRYISGDLGYMDEDGFVYYLNREKDLIVGPDGFKIIPSVITFHKPRGLYKLWRRNKPCLHYNILEPYYIEDLGNKRKTIEKAREDVNKIISDYFVKNSDYYYDENGNRNNTPVPSRKEPKKKKKDSAANN